MNKIKKKNLSNKIKYKEIAPLFRFQFSSEE